MIFRVTLLWIAGMVTIVPYAVYRLFTDAARDEMAFLIVIPFFWTFGFWGVVTPMMMAYKIHKLMRALDLAKSDDERKKLLLSPESKELAIEMMAEENHIPKFVARWMVNKLAVRLANLPAAEAAATPSASAEPTDQSP